jgi:hypothetical protein
MEERRVLDPIERVSEVLFGLIMVLTFTGSLSVASPDRSEVREMLVGAIGCNLAWGIVDAVMYVMASVMARARGLRVLRKVQNSVDHAEARAVIAGLLDPFVASRLRPDILEMAREDLAAVKDAPLRAPIARRLGALESSACLHVHASGGSAVHRHERRQGCAADVERDFRRDAVRRRLLAGALCGAAPMGHGPGHGDSWGGARRPNDCAWRVVARWPS